MARSNVSGNRDFPTRYTQRGDPIGSGSYGTVFEAVDHGTGDLVAIKWVRDLFRTPVDAKRVLREIAIQRSIRHPNIVGLTDVFLPMGGVVADFNSIFIVMEICDSDLKFLCKQRTAVVEAICVSKMMYTGLLGVRYLHSAGVYHRDLKPSNCLVNRDCTVKICDFGLSRAIDTESGRGTPVTARRTLTRRVVSRVYRAPELMLFMLEPNYTESVDMWSMGCICAELLRLMPGAPLEERGMLFPGSSAFPVSPVQGHEADPMYHIGSSQEMMNLIFDVIGSPSANEVAALEGEAQRYVNCFTRRPGIGIRNMFPWAGPAAVDLLDRMIRFNPASRIKDEEVLGHPFFSSVRTPDEEAAQAPQKLVFPFDEELAEPMTPDEMMQKLRTLFVEEVEKSGRVEGGEAHEPAVAVQVVAGANASLVNEGQVNHVEVFTGDAADLQPRPNEASPVEEDAAGATASKAAAGSPVEMLPEGTMAQPDVEWRAAEPGVTAGELQGEAVQNAGGPGGAHGVKACSVM